MALVYEVYSVAGDFEQAERNQASLFCIRGCALCISRLEAQRVRAETLAPGASYLLDP
jgi:hypothetical protein